MGVEMVLNELAIAVPAADVRTARDWMIGLVQTLRRATMLGASRVLRVEYGLDAILLGPDYAFARWRNDVEVDLEARRFIRSLTSKAPYLSDILDPEVTAKVTGCDFRLGGQPALGLGVAFVLQALAVSVRSGTRWDVPLLTITVTELDLDGELSDANVIVIHASSTDHVESHAEWISQRIKRDIANGRDLMARRGTLLPSLVFCDTAVASMEVLDAGSPLLASTLKRLFELQAYCDAWEAGPFDPKRLPSKASPESAPTLAKYSAERTILCPDGIYRLFSWHVRLTPNNWRIHFSPDAGNRQLIVGYVGPKLPTVDYPT